MVKGWHRESARHSQARKYGRAGGHKVKTSRWKHLKHHKKGNEFDRLFEKELGETGGAKKKRKRQIKRYVKGSRKFANRAVKKTSDWVEKEETGFEDWVGRRVSNYEKAQELKAQKREAERIKEAERKRIEKEKRDKEIEQRNIEEEEYQKKKQQSKKEYERKKAFIEAQEKAEAQHKEGTGRKGFD